MLNDVSEQPIGPILRVQDYFTSLRNNHYPLRNSPEQCSSKVLVFQEPEQDKFASLGVREVWNKKGAGK